MDDNVLYYGDNLDVLRQHIKDETVDLVYLDPPFNSKATYNVLFAEKSGAGSSAQIKAFDDTWHWDASAAEAFDDVLQYGGKPAEAMRAFETLLGHSDMLAYLSMMAPRLIELRRVLKPTGSIYLHCDPTASHYLKVLMDAVFGPASFINEIVWRSTGSHNPSRRFAPLHDVLLFYSKTSAYHFVPIRRPYMRGHVERRYVRDETGRHKFVTGGNILTGPGATSGDSGAPWRGFDPTAKRRHWAIPGYLAEQMPSGFGALGVTERLEALFQAGLIEVTPGAVWPHPVKYLSQSDGQAVSDIWAYQPYTEGTVFGTEAGIDADVAWLVSRSLSNTLHAASGLPV